MAGRFKFGGDFAKLQKLVEKLSRPREIVISVSRDMCDEALGLVSEGFQTEHDPYGKPWAPLKHRKGQILWDTGAMAGSWHREWANALGFLLRAGKEYAIYHQRGTRSTDGSVRIPVRRMVPSPGPLPPLWRDRLGDAARESLATKLGGA